MGNLNDPKFVADLLSGNAHSFTVMREQLSAPIVAFIRSVFRQIPHDGAEEIAGDTMFKVHKAIGKFDPGREGGAELKSWICGIAMNAAKDYLVKHKQHVPELISEEDAREPLASFDDPAVQQSESKHMQIPADDGQEDEEASNAEKTACVKALHSLDEKNISILRLREVLKLPFVRIAEMENTTPNNARMRYNRALAKARAAYEKEKLDER